VAELALRASEARLKEAQRLAKIGHWEFDFAKDDYLMSEEALRIHEFESADGRVPRADVAAMIHPEDRELLRERRSVALANCSDFEVVMRLMFQDGRMKYAHLRGAVHCNEQGQPVRVGGTLQDVTEQKQAELALRELNETLEQRVLDRTQELSRSLASLRETQAQLVQSEKMASLGGLVAGISHEINTPLGIGVTSATTLQEEFRSLRQAFEDNTLKRSTLERFISHGLNGCDILVTNLLRAAELIRSFKQVAVDQSSDDWRVINLHEYIDEIIVSLKPRLKSSRVQVLNESNGQLVLRTHPGAIYQILSNLVLNALIHAYAPDQPGTIRIRAERVGQDIELDVADDGKGVPADIQDRIFDPFFTTRRGTGGSGLGLHIVFNLVSGTLAGGIQLVKNASQGATFRIRFPVQSQSEDA
jgi:signal transduction histidine kinase